jgi:hypothetical protein
MIRKTLRKNEDGDARNGEERELDHGWDWDFGVAAEGSLALGSV